MAKEIIIPRQNLLPPRKAPDYQADADRRDRALKEEDRALGITQILNDPQELDPETPSVSSASDLERSDSTDPTDPESDSGTQGTPSTPWEVKSKNQKLWIIPRKAHARDVQDSLWKIEKNLRGMIRTPLLYKERPFELPPEPYRVNICAISTVSLHYHLKRPENEVFTSSLYE